MNTPHPTIDVVRAFAQGRLDGDSLHQVELHISACADCCTVLESFPEDTLTGLLRSVTTSEKPNLRLVPGYEIKEELGRGGMGVVYLATQPALRRDVALKMISRGEQANSQELVRFRREGRAIAALHHPSIAQVYEVGDQAGQPYIAMELVRGVTLAKLLQNGPLSAQDATQLIVRITDAVVHAHARGIVHRDLKPSNILLAEYPESHDDATEQRSLNPKIVDFGLAKRTGIQETATLPGMLVGTPSYMSPEQAAGLNDSVAEATDIYALGAILYETLAGRPPFQGSSPVEILEQVRSLEPVRLKSLRPEMPNDLETICLKCLEKLPASRYQSANALLDDLKRFQEGRPILAKPSGWSTRLIKWTKRHPATTAVAIVVAAATIGLLIVSLTYNRYLSEALDGARKERSRADSNFRYAFGAVERMLEQVGFSELANQPGMEAVRENLLKDAVKFYSTLLADQPADDVNAQRQYCVAMARLGHLQTILGHTNEGRTSLTDALALQKQLCVEFPNRNEIRHELAISHINLGLLNKTTVEEFQAAIELLEPIQDVYPICKRELAEAMNLYASSLPSESGVKFHLDVLSIRRKLLEESPEDPHLKHGLGQTLHNLGHTYMRIGQNEAAVRALEESLDFFEDLVNEHGEVTGYQVSLAECTAILASLEHADGKSAKSKALIERCIAVRTLLVDRFPKTPDFAKRLADGYLTYAAFLIQLQVFSGAVEQAEAAVHIAERLKKDYPSQEYQLLATASLTLFATSLDGNGQHLKSQEIFERACDEYDTLLAQSPENSSYQTEAGVHFMNYSNLLRPQDPEKALVYNDRAVTLLKQAYTQQPTRVDFCSYLFNAYGALAQTYEVLEKHLLAADAWDRAIQLSPGERITEMKIARGLALARAASLKKATEWALELAKMENLNGSELYNIACLYGLLDKQEPNNSSHRDHAFEMLQRTECIDFLSDTQNREQLSVDNDLESIQSDARFKQLLKSLTPG